MRRDIRDPRQVGERYLRLRRGGLEAAAAVMVPADDYPGDESPLDRYGDPRERHLSIETVYRRSPIERLGGAA